MEETETRDSCYYPGCKKDANCDCDICLASINATLDLMPLSIQKSSLTKFSTSRGTVIETTPLSFDPSIVSTPTSRSCRSMESPPLKSTARLSTKGKDKEKEKKRKTREGGIGAGFVRAILILSFFLGIELGFSWMLGWVFRPVLTKDGVKRIGEKSSAIQDLNGLLRFLQIGLSTAVVNGKISNCSHFDSLWSINQDGFPLNSRCVLYKSAVEEVSIWGWPLQTAGLLTTGFSSKSFTVLSGRVTKWSNGRIGFSVHKVNTSWVQKRLSGSAMQLDPNTWVLEYRWSSILENSRLFTTALEFLKYRISMVARKVKEEFWVLSDYGSQYRKLTAKEQILIPT